jgi:ribose transport system substrate-binding protein
MATSGGVWAVILKTIEIAGVAVAAVGAWFAYLTIEEQRIGTAWSLIGAAKNEEVGNIGLIESLTALAKRKKTLAKIQLSSAYVYKSDLPGVNLEGADLHRSNFGGADLRQAKLGGANLREVDLQRADLRGADLKGVDLTGANLSGADLRAADLRGATLRSATLFRANLRGMDTKLGLADLTDSDLRSADLSDANLDGANLTRTVLRSANLSKTIFDRSLLLQTDLRRAELAGAHFNGTIFSGANTEDACIDDTPGLPQNSVQYSNEKALVTSAKLWCGPPTSLERVPPARLRKKMNTIYYLIPTLIDDFQTESQKAIEVVFGALGYEIVSRNAGESIETQIRQFSEAIQQKPSAIILNAVDNGSRKLREQIKQARGVGIRILIYDRLMPDVEIDLAAVADAELIGRLAALEAVRLLRSRYEDKIKGTILQILGDPEDNYSADVQLGFLTTLANFREIKLMTGAAIHWDPANALKIAKDYITLDNSIDIIFAHGAELIVPIVSHLRRVGRKKADIRTVGDIMLMASNGAPPGLANVREGWQQAEIEQPLYSQVYGLAKFFSEMMSGRKLTDRTCDVLGASGVLVVRDGRGAVLTLSGAVITPENVDTQRRFWGNLRPPLASVGSICE